MDEWFLLPSSRLLLCFLDATTNTQPKDKDLEKINEKQHTMRATGCQARFDLSPRHASIFFPALSHSRSVARS